MVGIYFSGTGNSKYAAELFCKEYDKEFSAYSIEDTEALAAVADADLIIFAYPVQFSTVPKIMRDYISDHNELCPMRNIAIKDQKAVSSDRCTMCYRCINKCPGQALTLLGKMVVEQCGIEKYI